jgi:hypothetical protein
MSPIPSLGNAKQAENTTLGIEPWNLAIHSALGTRNPPVDASFSKVLGLHPRTGCAQRGVCRVETKSGHNPVLVEYHDRRSVSSLRGQISPAFSTFPFDSSVLYPAGISSPTCCGFEAMDPIGNHGRSFTNRVSHEVQNPNGSDDPNGSSTPRSFPMSCIGGIKGYLIQEATGNPPPSRRANNVS